MGFDYGKKLPDGQHQRHPGLPEDQLNYIQPVRQNYIHNTCGGNTSMPLHCAKTYATNPAYYGRTFCATCKDYYPTSEFVWPEDGKPINKPINE